MKTLIGTINRTLLMVLFFISIGCATLNMRRGLATEDVAKIKKVVVISLLDSKMIGLSIGTTVFQNKAQTVDAKDWNINKFAQQELLRDVKGQSSFADVEPLKKPMIVSLPLGKDGLRKILDEAKAEGFDTAIVLIPSRYDNAPQLEAGYGISRASRFGMKAHSYAYMLAAVFVYDVASGKTLAWQWAFDSISGNPNVTSKTEVPWKENPKDYSADDLAQIETTLKDQIKKQLAYAADALNLTGKR